MAKIITDNQHYKDIGAAIRTKNETDTLYKPSEMAPAILAIQGGVELNFKVVSGEKPSDPEPNTIWVNTPTEITGWSLSAEEPEAPIEGMVWVKTGFDKAFDFNAIKKNTLMVYAQNAFQYVSGKWIYTESEIYQNEEWNKLIYKPALAAELNAMGWARYSEGISGEYVRQNSRGFTRNSTLPVIWCAGTNEAGGTFIGYCMLAASSDALAITSLVGDSSGTSYLGEVYTGSVILPSGKTLHYAYAKYSFQGTDIRITSNGETYTLEHAKYSIAGQHFAPNATMDGPLIVWAERLLF